ncbi:MAG: hypothetical protein COA88_11675 [Kordia sp.]|nr:MAG: hypothetical protein COA88_11675 [Kordia sp.]
MKNLFTLFILLTAFPIFAQVGIGTTSPDPSSILDITDTNRGFLTPRMTEAQRDAISSPATGLLIYQLDSTPGFYYYDGTVWTPISSGGGQAWELTGNVGTSPSTNLLGTTDAQDFVLGTNSTEVMRVGSNANVGVNTANPTAKLHFTAATLANIPLDEGFESNTLGTLTSGGDVPWITTSAAGEYNSGSIGSKNDVIVKDQNSWLAYTTTIPATGGNISFAVSSDCLTMDKLTFTIDGVEKEQWSGVAKPWKNFSLPLIAGTYTFKWEFNKISNGTFYSDAAFLDDIKITTNASPTLQIKDGNNYPEKLLTSDANGVATWKNVGIDNDWAFPAGNTDADQIYHQGNIKIGDDDATIFNLHVEGSKNVGIGSIEYLDEGFSTLHISNGFAPITDNSIDLGTSTNRWKDVWSTNGVINTSDKRLKTNITPLEYGLAEILKLRTVSFKWKEEKVGDFVVPEEEKENKLGLIAQEVLKIIPEVIQTHEWKEYEENPGVLVKEEMRRIGISYSEIIPVITKAIQEQEKEIHALEQQNNRLKSMFNKLKNK